MYTFDKNAIYKFGILSKEGEQAPDAPNPDFMKKPNFTVVFGSDLVGSNMKTFRDYLYRNPHGYPVTKTVSCYRLDNADGNGRYILCEQGNPIPGSMKNEPDISSLADNLKGQVSHVILQQPNNNNNNGFKNTDDMNEFYVKQIQLLRDDVAQKTAENNNLISKIQAKDEEIITLRGEVQRAKIDYEYLNKKVDADMQKPSNGLADAATSFLNNDMVKEGLGAVMQILAAKFMPQQQTSIGQPGYGVNEADGYASVALKNAVPQNFGEM